MDLLDSFAVAIYLTPLVLNYFTTFGKAVIIQLSEFQTVQTAYQMEDITHVTILVWLVFKIDVKKVE